MIDNDPLCFNCEKATDRDHYCHGCRVFICDECEAGYSKASATIGSHEPADHLVEADDDDQDDD